METAAFITSLATSLVIFVLLLALYVLLLSRRAGNYSILYPAEALRGGTAEEQWARSSSSWAWLRDAFRARLSREIVSVAGMDAAVYVAMQQAALRVFGLAALFCIPVLVPLAALSNGYASSANSAAANSKTGANETFGGFDKLAMGNLPEGSAKVWAFVAGAYWLTVVTIVVLWREYRSITALRNEVLSASAEPPQFAVLLRDAPRGSSSSSVDEYFSSIHPGSYQCCVPAHDISKADKIWQSLQDAKKQLARSRTAATEQQRPTHKTGTLGLCGPSVDSIDFYTSQIAELERDLQQEQEKISQQQQQQQVRAAILVFETRTAAAMAAQSVHAGGYRWLTEEAPEPRELVWGNLRLRTLNRLLRRAGIYFLVLLIIVFYMIPISFISALTTLDNLQRLLPFVKPVVKIKVLNAVLQAYLPQLALILFLALLPRLLLFLSTLEGIASKSHIERAAAGKFFYFNVFNVFLGITITSSLWSSLKEIEKHPNKAVDLLGRSIPPAASFFITFIALKLFVGFGLRLSRIVPLLIFHLKRRFLCKTDEDVREAWAPGPFSYATDVPGDMLIFTIAMCYAVIAPMVLPFAFVYFALDCIISRHEALKVVVPAYESSGRMWPHMHARMLAALLLSQVAAIGYFSLKRFHYSPLLVPLPIATLVYAFLCHKLLFPAFKHTPLHTVSVQPKSSSSFQLSSSHVVAAYTPPCLRSEDPGHSSGAATAAGDAAAASDKV